VSTKPDFEYVTVGKIGRNEPCPCGSGRKFKKCHGSSQTQPRAFPSAAQSGPSDREKKIADAIPWGSLGRETVASKVGRSLLPVGILPFEPVPFSKEGIPAIDQHHPDVEKILMNIVGTAIQAGTGKLVTCLHVVDALISGLAQAQHKYFYILTRPFERT
jgi:hypothetical protein